MFPFDSHIDEHKATEDGADGTCWQFTGVDNDLGDKVASEHERRTEETRGREYETVVVTEESAGEMWDGHTHERHYTGRGHGYGGNEGGEREEPARSTAHIETKGEGIVVA